MEFGTSWVTASADATLRFLFINLKIPHKTNFLTFSPHPSISMRPHVDLNWKLLWFMKIISGISWYTFATNFLWTCLDCSKTQNVLDVVSLFVNALSKFPWIRVSALFTMCTLGFTSLNYFLRDAPFWKLSRTTNFNWHLTCQNVKVGFIFEFDCTQPPPRWPIEIV